MYEVEVAGPPLCIAMNGQDGGEIKRDNYYHDIKVLPTTR